MSFNPSSAIYLCNAPIDSTYQNEIYFSNAVEQREYFQSKVVKTFTDYLTVRTTRADGSLQSSVKVNANIDEIRSLPCNYMFYQNANHGSRFFYAFITKMIYINEGTTELVFETDVYQTWLFDVELKQSYVVREHSETDNIGDNLVPESFNFQDYVYQPLEITDALDEYGYIMGTTENDLDEPSFWEELFGSDSKPVYHMQMQSGILQGLYFYYFHDDGNNNTHLNSVVNRLIEKNGDCIVFISTIPKFNVSASTFGVTAEDLMVDAGYIKSSKTPAEKTIPIIPPPTENGSFEGYAPYNNKLFTSPFYKIVITNHNGEQGEYNIEDFVNPLQPKFKLYGDVSANPTTTLIPLYYKGIMENYDAGISISGYPQCSLNVDTFKLWLAKNQYSIGVDTIANVGQIIAGVAAVAAAPATGGASLSVGALLGSQGVINGAQGIMSTVNSVYQANREPNKSSSGGGKTNLLTAIGKNKFEFYIQTIRREHARTIDTFFTMYGYQTNKLKVPNVSKRPFFNYVQTVDVNIIGGIPSDDLIKLKSIYNKGVTLWKPHATVGDYSVDNRPV